MCIRDRDPTYSRPVPFGREAGTEWSDDLNSPPADGDSWGVVSSVESLVASGLGVILVLMLVVLLVLMLVVLGLVRLLVFDFLRVLFEAFESFASIFFCLGCCVLLSSCAPRWQGGGKDGRANNGGW